MNITKDDLLQYRSEREAALQALEQEKNQKVEEIHKKVEAYKKQLVEEHATAYAEATSTIKAEIGILDTLIAKTDAPEAETEEEII